MTQVFDALIIDENNYPPVILVLFLDDPSQSAIIMQSLDQ